MELLLACLLLVIKVLDFYERGNCTQLCSWTYGYPTKVHMGAEIFLQDKEPPPSNLPVPVWCLFVICLQGGGDVFY